MAEALAEFNCKPCPKCHFSLGGLLILNGDYEVCNECGYEPDIYNPKIYNFREVDNEDTEFNTGT